MREVLVVASLAVAPGIAVAQEACTLDWRLEETLRIGSVDGPDALSRVPSLAIGPDGEIYAPQPASGQVLVFSADGELLRSFGRFGSGPGDFQDGPRVVTWAGGELWVADRLRAQSFGPDDTPRAFVQFQYFDPDEGIFSRPEAPLADGTMWAKNSWTPVPTRDRTPSIAVRRFDEEGTVVDSVVVLDARGDRVVTNPETGGFAMNPFRALLAGSTNNRLRDGLDAARATLTLVGNVRPEAQPPAFDLLRMSISGDTLDVWSIPYEPIAMERADREWWVREFSATIAGDYSIGRPGYLQMTEAQRNRARARARDALVLPEYYPPVRQLVAGGDGTVWLLREPDLSGFTNRWEVYGDGGTLLGRVTENFGASPLTPWLPNLQVMRVSADEVWGTIVDALEVPYIVRFRVTDSCG